MMKLPRTSTDFSFVTGFVLRAMKNMSAKLLAPAGSRAPLVGSSPWAAATPVTASTHSRPTRTTSSADRICTRCFRLNGEALCDRGGGGARVWDHSSSVPSRLRARFTTSPCPCAVAIARARSKRRRAVRGCR